LLTIKEGRLVLSPRGSSPVPNLVDALLHSLAEDRGEQAIGIVLSDSGSDGAIGVETTLRIWVPVCSTGEEVYSIAILMREYMDTLRGAPKLQIFATDIDEGALAVARYGTYPNALLQGVSQRRLDRFFSKQEGRYTVAKEIRDFCIFSTQRHS
jgi:chemotaxis methyl-accepting protein methylase